MINTMTNNVNTNAAYDTPGPEPSELCFPVAPTSGVSSEQKQMDASLSD